MRQLLKIIKNENPIFVLMLGLCSSLAVTTKVENAYLMGLSVFIVLLFSEIVVSLIKKLVPDNIKIPVYIVIIGTFVTLLEMVLKEYINPLYQSLSIYLPLIVVNCIVLGRVLSVSSKSNLKTSIKDAIGISLGYMLALILIALLREVLGNNTITLVDSLSNITNFKVIINVFPKNNIIPMSFMTSPSGAFIILGLLMALFNKIGGEKNESN